MTTKWFYSAQDEIEQYLKGNFKDYSHLKQTVTSNIVLEWYNVWDNEGHVQTILFVIEKTWKDWNLGIYSDTFNKVVQMEII